jgi:hypothetical protein
MLRPQAGGPAPADLPGACSRRILGSVTVVLLSLSALVAAVALAATTGGIRIRRYSAAHVDLRLTIAGRGLYLSHTPDGTWWRFRLRPRRCGFEDRSGWGDPPPDIGVREPRRPRGPQPLSAAVELDPPRD